MATSPVSIGGVKAGYGVYQIKLNKNNMKGIAEIFEGKDSSLYKTYQNAQELVGFSSKPTKTSERAELIRDILELVNKEREGTKYKPITGVQLAVKLAHIPTKDFYGILSMGKDYKARGNSFGRYLFGALKVKK